MPAVTASGGRIPELLPCRIPTATAFGRVINNSQKNKDTWCEVLRHNKMPNKIQPRDRFLASKGGGIDDISYIWFCLAESGRQPQRPVSELERQGAQPEPQLV